MKYPFSLAPSHVSFRGHFNKEHTARHPAGSDIVDMLEQQLPIQNVEVIERNQTDYSHSFMLIVDGRRFDAMVAIVEDDTAEWLLFFKPHGILFLLVEVLSAVQRMKLAKALHATLSSDARISEIRWYKNSDAWNCQINNAYTPTPEA